MEGCKRYSENPTNNPKVIFFANLPFFSCKEEELLEIILIEALDGVEGGEYGEGLTVESWSSGVHSDILCWSFVTTPSRSHLRCFF